MYTSVNAILRFNETSIKYNDNGTVVEISDISKDDTTQTLIINMMALFNELSSKYPKNIKIESEE